MHVFFRVDVSDKIGSGHIKRCQRIAGLFKPSQITFIIANQNINYDFFSNLNYKKYYFSNVNYNIEKDIRYTTSILKKIDGKKLLIADSYKLNQLWEKKIKKYVDKLVIIDDLPRKHYSDLLINQNWYFKDNKIYLNKYKNIKNIAFGPNFFLGDKKIKKNDKKIYWTIFFGGSDQDNITLKILKKIPKNKKIKICVVTLNASKNNLNDINNYIRKNNLTNITVKKNLKKFNSILNKTKFFVGSGGSASWERLLYEIPSLIIPTSKDQIHISRNLYKNGLQLLIEKEKILKRKSLNKEMIRLEKNYFKIKKKLSNLIDGQGLKRIKLLISDKINIKSDFRYVKKIDLGFLFFCVNHQTSIRSRFKSKEIKITEHFNWFYKTLKNKNIEFFMILINKIPVGFLRYDIKKNVALIDIYIDSNFRNYKIGSEILSKTMEKIKNERKIKKFVAKIKKNNFVSINFFKKNFFIKKNNGFERII